MRAIEAEFRGIAASAGQIRWFVPRIDKFYLGGSIPGEPIAWIGKPALGAAGPNSPMRIGIAK
jgi:hypothetical protein